MIRRLICWFKGHVEVSCIRDIGAGQLVYTHDYCERCGKVLRVNFWGWLKAEWVDIYKGMPTEYKKLYEDK